MSKKTEIDLGQLYDPSKNPKQLLAHTVPERYVLYGGAYSGGKTAWLVNEAIRLSVAYPGNIGWIGCKYLTDFKANALGQLLKFLPKELIATHHQSDHFIRLKNGSTIMYGGLGNDIEAETTINNMTSLGWFAVDQAEEISEHQFSLLTGRLRLPLPGVLYKGLLTANPDPGWLRDTFIEKALYDHRYIPALPNDNPFTPKDYVQRLRERYPESLIRRLLEGDWDVATSPNLLIAYGEIRDAVKRKTEPKGDRIAGVDIAREGGDETVFILKQGEKVLHIESWAKEDTTYSAGRIARLIREHKPEMTYIDSIGIGVGAFDPLKNEGFAVTGIDVGEKALDSEVYLNKKAEYFNLLAKRFEKGTIDIPDNTKLQSQLASIRYEYVNQRLRIWSKERMKAKGWKSPDYAEALMLAFCRPDGATQLGVIPVKHWG